MYRWDHGWMYDGSGGWMIFGWLWMILLGLIPIFILFALAKYLFGATKRDMPQITQEPRRKALDLLDEAYAKGDISREEYLQKKEDLK